MIYQCKSSAIHYNTIYKSSSLPWRCFRRTCSPSARCSWTRTPWSRWPWRQMTSGHYIDWDCDDDISITHHDPNGSDHQWWWIVIVMMSTNLLQIMWVDGVEGGVWCSEIPFIIKTHLPRSFVVSVFPVPAGPFEKILLVHKMTIVVMNWQFW